eukprot:TCONS_00002300-protein
MCTVLYFYVFLIFTFCFEVSHGIEPRTIHVSRDMMSKDTINCGSIHQPCFYLNHAINISLDGDIILLDSQYQYVRNETIVIPHSLEISSYCGNTSFNCSGERANVLFESDQKMLSLTLFSLSGNVSLQHLSIGFRRLLNISHPGSWSRVNISVLHLNPSLKKVKFVKCNFEWPKSPRLVFVQTVLIDGYGFCNVTFTACRFKTPLHHKKINERDSQIKPSKGSHEELIPERQTVMK